MTTDELPPDAVELKPAKRIPLDALPDGQIQIARQVLEFMQRFADLNPDCEWMPFDLEGSVRQGLDKRIGPAIRILSAAGLVRILQFRNPMTGATLAVAKII